MVRVDENGYSLAHVVKTTEQARRDLVKAAQQLRAIGNNVQAAAMEKLAGLPEIDLSKEEE